jgi:hypothetical protein
MRGGVRPWYGRVLWRGAQTVTQRSCATRANGRARRSTGEAKRRIAQAEYSRAARRHSTVPSARYGAGRVELGSAEAMYSRVPYRCGEVSIRQRLLRSLALPSTSGGLA